MKKFCKKLEISKFLSQKDIFKIPLDFMKYTFLQQLNG